MQISGEVRWFQLGEAPLELSSWFQSTRVHQCPPGGGEIRVDRYLVDPGNLELGIKYRGGKSGLEVKGLVKTSEPGLAIKPFIAPVEIWAKWTSESVKLHSEDTVAVEKKRWLRKFDTTKESPREIALDKFEQPLGREPLPVCGCNAEFAVIRLPDGAAWWTFGFEAFGPLDKVERALQAAALVLANRNPPSLEKTMISSYPVWLAKSVYRKN